MVTRAVYHIGEKEQYELEVRQAVRMMASVVRMRNTAFEHTTAAVATGIAKVIAAMFGK